MITPLRMEQGVLKKLDVRVQRAAAIDRALRHLRLKRTPYIHITATARGERRDLGHYEATFTTMAAGKLPKVSQMDLTDEQRRVLWDPHASPITELVQQRIENLSSGAEQPLSPDASHTSKRDMRVTQEGELAGRAEEQLIIKVRPSLPSRHNRFRLFFR